MLRLLVHVHVEMLLNALQQMSGKVSAAFSVERPLSSAEPFLKDSGLDLVADQEDWLGMN